MSIAARLRGLGRFDALVLTSVLWFLGKFLRYAFPPLFESLGSTYGVSRAVLGSAFTGFMLVYAALQFPSGMMADRLGSVRVIAAGALLAAAGALVLAVDSPFAVLAGAMVLMGAGTGAHKTVAVRLLSRVYPTRTGRALGVFDTFGTLGGVAAPAAVVAIAGVPGVFGAPWRTLFLAAGLAGVVGTVAFVSRVPGRLSETGADATAPDGSVGGDAGTAGSTDSDTAGSADAGTAGSTDADTAETAGDAGGTDDDETADAGTGADAGESVALREYVALFREWRFSTFVAVTVLFAFAYNGTVAFLPLYLTDEAGLASSTANLIYSVLFVASFVQPVTGEVSDRVGTLPVIALVLGLATASLFGLLALTGSGRPLALGAVVICLGLGAHGYRPVRAAYLMSVMPTSVAGGSLGVVRTLLMGAGAVAPAVVGTMADTVGFRPAFALLGAALVGATALAAFLWAVDR